MYIVCPLYRSRILTRGPNCDTLLHESTATRKACAVNLVVHRTNERYPGDLELCIRHEVSVILTSKGAPEDVFRQIHDYGGVAFHDIASRRHAEKALEAGADGLIAVCGGAGGHCGTLNPFALLNEVRAITDKPIVLGGSLSTGRDIVAALAMGADLAYMGTRFIPVRESLASEDYRSALFGATAKDVLFTTALDGFPANFLVPSIEAAGLDLDEVKATPPGAHTAARSIGLAQGALEQAIAYSKERIQFRRPIADFQAIRFKIANMAAEVEAARQLNYSVCAKIDTGVSCAKEAAMVKYYAAEMSERVCSDALQVLAGAGYTTDYPVERYWRDARLTKIFEGTSEIMLKIVSDELLGKPSRRS